jgi:peroxin-11B
LLLATSSGRPRISRLGRRTGADRSYAVGRDKTLRTIQYFSRFYAWYLYRTNHAKSAVEPWEGVKKSFGSARKILRLGKFVEHLKAAAAASDAKVMDPVLRFCAVGRQLGYAMYLILDNTATVDSIGFKKFTHIKRIQREAYRAWFFGIVFNIVASVYTLARLRQKRALVDAKEAEGKVEEKKLEK